MNQLSIVLAFCLTLLGSGFLNAQNLIIKNLRCEYKTNPIGIDELTPRLKWEIQSSVRDVMQTAYQIRIAVNKADLLDGINLIWDPGKLDSDQSVHVKYKGESLQSRQRCYWQVKVWDNHGNISDWSEPNYWEMGLLSPAEWQAKWIRSSLEEDVSKSQPANLLRKDFKTGGTIRSARLYITSLGLYEVLINGNKAGNQLFTPGWTSYHNRLQYQTYDVTDLLREGENSIGVTLGDGWYRGHIGWSSQRNFYGDKLAMLFQLEITYDNGSKETIISDDSWKASTGPVLASDIYNGEIYDARLEQAGWTLPGFNDKSWEDVILMDHPKDILIAPAGPPVRRIQELPTVRIFKTPRGETVYDFGQNMVGRIRLKVNGEAGKTIILHHAEVLDKAGNFYTENLRGAQARVIYTLKGNGTEIYEPLFTFSGFRYVKVEGIENPEKDHLTGIVIHSDMKPTGDFSCSDPLINQLQHNIRWGQKGNFLDVPTDCPQRDERMGWTGDAQAFASTAAFNMDVAAFFTKWLQDLEADQNEAGMVPYVIPNVLQPTAGGSAGWADAATIIPWNMYLAYGDKRILERQYNSMKAWVKYMEDKAGEDGLWNTGFHFGDWLFYSKNDDRDGISAITDKYLIAQAFFINSAELLFKTAKVLIRNEDATYYADLVKNLKEMFHKEYLTPNGRLVSSTQTAYVLALQFGLLPEAMREQAAGRLVKNIERYDNHITTGFLGTPYICDVLTQFGYIDKAYTLLEQKTYPSWLYPVTMGATTIWERWDGVKPDSTFQNAGMNSFNHYAYGAIGHWMYTTVAGINPDEKQPGYKHIIITPQPGGTLTYAKATYHSMYGNIKSGWKLDERSMQVDVEVPPNTTATVYLPQAKQEEVQESGHTLSGDLNGIHTIQQLNNRVKIEIGSGVYSFSYPISK